MDLSLQDCKDIVTMCGTGLTLLIAYQALNTWKRQLKGTDEYKILKDLMKATYKIQDRIRYVRDPMVSYKQEDIEAKGKLSIEVDIYNTRFELLKNDYLELKSILIEAKVLCDENIETKFLSLEKIIRELRGAIWLHFYAQGAYSNGFNKPSIEREKIIDAEAILYDVSSNEGEDVFAKKVTAEIKVIEKYILPKLKH